MAEAFDYAIDTLKFRLAVDNTAYSSTNQGRPYVRSTAPFQKNQFDASQTVGDQSLTGWWTRGQLSFHMGAGVKYYEVLDGQTVLNRYDQSLGVDPSKPGEVSLVRELRSPITTTATNVTDLAPTVNGFVYLDGTTLYQVGGPNYPAAPSAITLAGSGLTPTRIVSDGVSQVFVAMSDNSIQRWSSVVGTPTTIYTASETITDLWYAKGRLWVLTLSGSLYAVSGKPASSTPLASPVAVFQETPTSNNQASLTASGTAVYVTLASNRIYSIGLSSDGSVPTLAAPVVAAELPQGEVINTIRYHLGSLVIVGIAGVRVAQETGNGVVYGPVLIPTAGTNSAAIGAQGTTVFVVASKYGATDLSSGQQVYAIDLGQQTSNNLEYAWRTAYTLTTGTTPAGPFGVAELTVQGLLFWGAGTLQTNVKNAAIGDPNKISSGTLTTGAHRFGTLEPKTFQNLLVRYGGTGGTIKVEVIDVAGNASTVATVPVTASNPGELALNLSGPMEFMSLRFTLTRDGTDATKGPVLYGYQLKAMPVPKRQRMIQVPLDVRDTVRLAGGTLSGRPGQGWSNLAALEALESSKAIVPFTDYRTHETGQAYIDSVEFYGDTLTSPQDRSFGGIAYVSLRVVS